MKNFYSPNFNKKKRLISSIKLVIIHYTGMQSERESIKRLCSPLSKVSAHYLISQNGKIFKLVEEIVNNKIEDVKLVINCGSLDKKSKIRTFFEKNKNTICIAFYADELKTLRYLANDFFKKKKFLFLKKQLII